MQLFGIVVITCCQTRVPSPKKTHQIHCSRLRGAVEKAMPPNWTIITCKQFNPGLGSRRLPFRSYLSNEGGDPNDIVDRVGEQADEDVPLAVDLTRVDLVKQGHHDK